MSADLCYYWAVICKNRKFHDVQNQFFGHKILLAETDAYNPMPDLDDRFTVPCDDCGREYSYKPKDVQRLESEYMEDLKPHPLFVSFKWLSGSDNAPASEAASPQLASVCVPEQRRAAFLQRCLKGMQGGYARLRTTLGR